MARRPPKGGVGEPLFGEKWWASDQRLFQDSLTRRAAARTAPRRPRRPATLRKQDAAAGIDDGQVTAVLGRELDTLGARREVDLQPGELGGFPPAARVERTPNAKVATLSCAARQGPASWSRRASWPMQIRLRW